MKSRYFIFVGPPGSGKGTQADILARAEKLNKIDVGSVLRDRTKEADAEGQEINQAMLAGKMINDDLLEKIIRPVIQNNSAGGFVLDGYCRNDVQVKHLHNWISSGLMQEPQIVFINIDTNKTMERISKRLYCTKCHQTSYLMNNEEDNRICRHCGGQLIKRPDDNVETFKKRVETYEQSAVPAIEELKQLYPFIKINGDQTIEEVSQEIRAKLGTHEPH